MTEKYNYCDFEMMAACRAVEALAQPKQEPTKEKIIEALKLAQETLYMATLPFPLDEAKTLKALHAVDDVLDAMPLFNDWPGGFK
jgi:hypothetical protein